MPAKCGSSPRAKVGIDLSVSDSRAGQAHVERPFLLAPPAVLRQPALGLDRLPAAGLAGVEVGVMAAGALGRWRQAGDSGRRLSRGDAGIMAWASSCGFSLLRIERVVSSASAAAVALLGEAACGAAVPVERQVVGDGRRAGRIVGPDAVEDDEPGAELEGLGDVVGDHEDGHAGVAPERRW